MTSPLNRSAQAGMGSGVEGCGEQGASPSGSGSCPDGPSASPSVLPDGDPSRGPLNWKLSDEARARIAEIDRHIVPLPPMLPDQIAYLRYLGASLQAERQFDAETLIGPCGPAAGFDGYGSQARPLCTLTGHPCGTDTVRHGDSCPDPRNVWRCKKLSQLASGTEAQRAETRSGSVEDEGPAPSGETPSQSPDPLSQTVAPSTEEKE